MLAALEALAATRSAPNLTPDWTGDQMAGVGPEATRAFGRNAQRAVIPRQNVALDMRPDLDDHDRALFGVRQWISGRGWAKPSALVGMRPRLADISIDADVLPGSDRREIVAQLGVNLGDPQAPPTQGDRQSGRDRPSCEADETRAFDPTVCRSLPSAALITVMFSARSGRFDQRLASRLDGGRPGATWSTPISTRRLKQ